MVLQVTVQQEGSQEGSKDKITAPRNHRRQVTGPIHQEQVFSCLTHRRGVPKHPCARTHTIPLCENQRVTPSARMGVHPERISDWLLAHVLPAAVSVGSCARWAPSLRGRIGGGVCPSIRRTHSERAAPRGPAGFFRRCCGQWRCSDAEVVSTKEAVAEVLPRGLDGAVVTT